MISLDLNVSVADGTTATTPFLELFGEIVESRGWQGQARDDGHAFAATTLGLSSDADHRVFATRLVRCDQSTREGLSFGVDVHGVKSRQRSRVRQRSVGLE